jgi:hypothetical protein
MVRRSLGHSVIAVKQFRLKGLPPRSGRITETQLLSPSGGMVRGRSSNPPSSAAEWSHRSRRRRRTAFLSAARRCSRPFRSARSPRRASAVLWGGSREPRSRRGPKKFDRRVRRASGMGPGRDLARFGFASSRFGPRRRIAAVLRHERSPLAVPDSWLWPPIGTPGSIPPAGQEEVLTNHLGDAVAVVLVEVSARAPTKRWPFVRPMRIERRRSSSRVNGMAGHFPLPAAGQCREEIRTSGRPSSNWLRRARWFGVRSNSAALNWARACLPD